MIRIWWQLVVSHSQHYPGKDDDSSSYLSKQARFVDYQKLMRCRCYWKVVSELLQLSKVIVDVLALRSLQSSLQLIDV